MRKSYLQGLWRLVDPKVSLASIASLSLGFMVSAAEGPLDIFWASLTVVSILALEVGKNASGEIFDFDSGADLAVEPEDRSPFSGGKRVLVEELLSRREVVSISICAYAIGIAGGLIIAFERHWGVLPLGLVGVALAYFYHAPPLMLSYRGMGELAVAIVYGPLIAAGTFLVQRGYLTTEIVLVSIPLGLLISAFLWVNEFPDYRADLAAGKNTLVVRFGRVRASRAYVAIVCSAFLELLLLPTLGVSKGVWVGFAAVVPVAAAASRLLRSPDRTEELIPVQGLSLVAFLVYALGAGIGLLFV